MGWTPQAILTCGLAEFHACLDGWAKANGRGEADEPPAGGKMTPERARELAEEGADLFGDMG